MRIVLVLYGIVSLAGLVTGCFYLFRPEFMPYHAAAIATDWAALPADYQVLYLAFLKVCGAGFISVGIAVAVLTAVPLRRNERWAKWLIPAIGLVFWLPTFYAPVMVTVKTPATAPWLGSLAIVGCILAAGVISIMPGHGHDGNRP